MSQQLLIYITLAIFFIVLALLLILRKTHRKPQDYDISSSERMFGAVLEKAVGGRFEIYCKVPLAQVFEPSHSLSERAKRRALKQVQVYQFDYLVCERDTRKVVCAVELDDQGFSSKDFKKKSAPLEQICQSTALPLLRVAPQNGYNLVEIIERFEQTIELHQPTAPVGDKSLQLCAQFLPLAA